MTRRRGDIRIGISGWRYTPWRGVYYPAGLPQRRELEYAAGTFRTLEINGTFYSLQRPDNFRAWRDATPDDFVFAVKAPRYIPHVRRLRDIDKPLANFLASGVLELGPKLGPLLWQFPPNFRYDAERFADFIAALPRTQAAALALARRREPGRMKGRTALPTKTLGTLRHAVEIRHESFRDPDFARLLRAHGVALVVADTAGRWPYLEEVTADFLYLRLHGDEELYASGYSKAALARWARRIDAWHRGSQPADARRIATTRVPARARDVYVYFDNDIKVHAPYDAYALSERLDVATGAPPGRPAPEEDA